VDVFVEGLVSIDRLEEMSGMRCMYRERDHAIVCEPYRSSGRGSRGAAGHIFKIGDRVRIRAERIDPFRHRVEFAPVVLETLSATAPKSRPRQ
jgi:hypothetical protein